MSPTRKLRYHAGEMAGKRPETRPTLDERDYTPTMDDATKRANEDLKRYNAHNLTGVPDFGRMAEEYTALPRAGRRIWAFIIIGCIMAVPIVALVLAVLR